MSAIVSKVEMIGLDEFRRLLRQLPEHLAEEAGEIVTTHAEQAARQIESNYPDGPTGNLKRRVFVTRSTANRFGAAALVRSSAPHAWMYENGTVKRETKGNGPIIKKKANRGTMRQAPEAQRMIPMVIRFRRKMVEALVRMLRDEGFDVSLGVLD